MFHALIIGVDAKLSSWTDFGHVNCSYRHFTVHFTFNTLIIFVKYRLLLFNWERV